MKNLKTRDIIIIAMMSALSFVLYAFEFMVMPPLKIDLSDLPVLIMSVVSGPIPAIIIALVKNILHAIFLMKEPLFSGEIANFAYCIAYLIPLSFLYKSGKVNKYIAILCSIIFSTVIMFFVNLFITFPLYGMSISLENIGLLLSTFTPFNIVKGSILGVLLVLLLRYLEKPLKKLS